MVISGEEMGKLRSLIVHAYSKDDFPEFLMTKYDRDFDNIEGNCYENQVFNLIEDFDRRGQIPFLKFISDIRDGRPDERNLRAFCDNILTEASRNEVEELTEKQKKEEMLKHYLMEVTKSFKEEKLIVFLGSGINYAPGTTNLPPSDIDIARYLDTDGDGDSLARIVDIPCQICPVTLDKRPKILGVPDQDHLHCPIWDKIHNDNHDKQERDKNEQDLAFARLQMRYLSNESTRNKLSKLLRDECHQHPYEPNKIQRDLADIACQRSLLILTTNYDVGLEKAFEEKKLDFDVIYYFIKEPGFTGSFWYKSYDYKKNGNKNNGPATKIAPGGFGLAKPIIFKLYGGVLYDAGQEYDSFAIAESHFINYLIGRNLQKLLPEQITKQLEKSDILFLGCNPNDTELLALLHRFFPQAFIPCKESHKVWLVNHLNFKIIDDKNSWVGKERHLIDQCSSEYFLSKLQENLTKTEVVS
jgi:hypothetical protein